MSERKDLWISGICGFSVLLCLQLGEVINRKRTTDLPFIMGSGKMGLSTSRQERPYEVKRK